MGPSKTLPLNPVHASHSRSRHLQGRPRGLAHLGMWGVVVGAGGKGALGVKSDLMSELFQAMH